MELFINLLILLKEHGMQPEQIINQLELKLIINIILINRFQVGLVKKYIQEIQEQIFLINILILQKYKKLESYRLLKLYVILYQQFREIYLLREVMVKLLLD